MKADVAIVGGGLAGLACARRLQQLGVDFVLLEAADRVGGRVRTDTRDGYLLDHGFQVFLTAYPEARRILAYERLNLHAFYPGALIQTERERMRMSDPWRRPREAFGELASSVAALSDKARLGLLRRRVLSKSIDEILSAPELSTRQALRDMTFSEEFIRRFFRPFFGGVFLDPKLETSRRMLEFVLAMFATGDAAVPAEGMEAIPRLIADGIEEGRIRTDTEVEAIDGTAVRIKDGDTLECSSVVVAVEGPAASRLVPNLPTPPYRPVACLYFECEAAPVTDPILVLNGTDRGPINNLCFPSRICPSYSTTGRDLVSVTVLRTQAKSGKKLLASVKSQLVGWFGTEAESWKHLVTYDIAAALPSKLPTEQTRSRIEGLAEHGVFVCGDHCDTPSINGALASGRRAAESLALARKG